jgi:hypothetical protein
MSERIELHSDVTRAESIRGIKQSRELRPEEARKKFAFELDKKLNQEKDKKKKDDRPDDEIILHQSNPDEDESKDQEQQPPDDTENNINNDGKPKIDFLA